MKERTNRRNVTLTIALALLMVALFSTTACSKKAEPKEEEKAPNENVVETKVEEKEETAEVAPEPTTEAATEVETEVSSELIVYEGIDYESTLPGAEWIETFVGIIDEPKLVVFNDETNKKVIVEDGQIISFERTDTMAVYLPDGVRHMSSGGGLVKEIRDNEHSSEITKLNMERLEEESRALKEILGGAEFYIILDNNGEEQQLNYIVSLVE